MAPAAREKGEAKNRPTLLHFYNQRAQGKAARMAGREDTGSSGNPKGGGLYPMGYGSAAADVACIATSFRCCPSCRKQRR